MFTTSSDWFAGFSGSFVIGQSGHFCSGFTTLSWKPLYALSLFTDAADDSPKNVSCIRNVTTYYSTEDDILENGKWDFMFNTKWCDKSKFSRTNRKRSGFEINKSCDRRRDDFTVNIQSCVLLEILCCLVEVQDLTWYFAPQEQQLVKAAQGKSSLSNPVSVAHRSGPRTWNPGVSLWPLAGAFSR